MLLRLLYGKEIETLFIERAAQLVKPEGLAAIIMPDQILYKSYTSYVGARELLFQKSAVGFSRKMKPRSRWRPVAVLPASSSARTASS